MRKAGQFFFALIPLLLSIGLQFLIVFFSMGVSGLAEGIWYAAVKSGDFTAVLEDLNILWTTQNFLVYTMVCYSVISIAVFGLWYYTRYDGNYLPRLKTTFHPLSFLGIIMLIPGTQFLTSYLIGFLSALFPSWLDTYMELMETSGLDNRITVGLFLYSVLLGPVSEELIFRGVTMRQLEKCLPFWAANLIQALLFGIFHMNMLQGVYAFCLGAVLGYLCKKGGSIYHSILLHIFYNFWGTVISQYLNIGESAFAFLFWFLFALALTAGGIAVFISGIRRCQAVSVQIQEEEAAAGEV